MNIFRYTKDCVIKNFSRYTTIAVFIAMSIIVLSTFFMGRYAITRTVLKVPIFLTINQGKIYKCNYKQECILTNLSEEDFFKNKQMIGKIKEESDSIVLDSLSDYNSLICNKFYEKCDQEKLENIKTDIFNLLYQKDATGNSIQTIYLALKDSFEHNTKKDQNKCLFYDQYKKYGKRLPCSIGKSYLKITGSILLQNMYNNISFTEEGLNKKPFFDEYIKYAKSSHTIYNWFDWRFFNNCNSVHSDFAGIKNSIYGSFATIGISLLFSIIIGTLTALFIEEFWKNKRSIIRRIIIINIDNMSAIPSVLCGLFGAVIYINILHLPRSSILVGAFTISFMIFPLIVISARNAIMSVPKDIKDLAYSMGASKYRVAFCHTIPMSINGIITGSLLTVGKAAGETACLLIVGLTAFSSELPKSIFDNTSTIATQVYTWMEMPDINFQYRIYAGMSLLIFISFSISLIVRTTGYYKKKINK